MQPQHAATVCEIDLVRHASGQETGSGLNPNTNSRRTANEPLNPTLDFKHAHVSGPPLSNGAIQPAWLTTAAAQLSKRGCTGAQLVVKCLTSFALSSRQGSRSCLL